MAPPGPAVRSHRQGNLLLFRLDDPSGYPRLTRAVLEELLGQIRAFQEEPGVRAAVVTGTEKCFAAGADLAEVSALTAVEALRFAEMGQSVMRAIEHARKPVIAAIRGYCLGGGLDLALACHVRVASSDAVFAHPGAALGILTGWGGTQRLPRSLGHGGRAQALEMLTTGEKFTAEEVYRWGLLSKVVAPDRVLPVAMFLARGGDIADGFDRFQPARQR